jgi:hypothetical protein
MILNTKLNFERQKYNTMIVHLKSNNLSLCLNHEYLKFVLPKNILKTRVDFGIMFLQNVVLYEIYSKKSQ